MSGVEIEFSVENGESGTQDSNERSETEASDSRTQARTTTGGPSRIQGQWHCDPRQQVTNFHRLVPTQIMQLLGHAGLRRIFANHRAGGAGIALQLDDGNEILDVGLGGRATRSRCAKGSTNNKYPPVPSNEGRKLMDGGVFGSNEYYRDTTRKRNMRLARKLLSRELGSGRGHSTKVASAISQV